MLSPRQTVVDNLRPPSNIIVISGRKKIRRRGEHFPRDHKEATKPKSKRLEVTTMDA